MLMKKRTVLISIILFSIISVNAQFYEGYLITNDNDTIKGYLQNLSSSQSCIKVIFKEDPYAKEKQTYEPGTIKRYKFDDQYYQRFKALAPEDNQKPVFMKTLEGLGKAATLYEYVYKKGNSDQTDYYIAKHNGDYMLVTKKSFKNELGVFLNDEPDIAKSIDDRKFKFDEIDLLVSFYNRLKLNEWYDQ